MTKYQYIAVNRQNQKLSGSIEATDQASAQNELNEMGLSVLEIKTAAPSLEVDTADKISFAFLATDKNGKKINGTIKSTDEKSAWRKLTEEYQFQVQELSFTGDGLKNKVDLTILQNNFNAENNFPAKENSATPNTAKRDIEVKIEQILQKVNESLVALKDKLKPEAKILLKKQIDKLQLIKSSTNVAYIEDSAAKLLAEIQKQENYLAANEVIDEKNRLVLATQKLMLEIQKGEAKPGFSESISSKIKALSAIDLQGESGFLRHFLSELGVKIIKLLEVPPAIRLQKEKIALVRAQIWTYRKRWLLEKNHRAEIESALKTLGQEKNRLQNELEALKNAPTETSASLTDQLPPHHHTGRLLALNTFSGWLLAFYTVYYLIGFILSHKNLGFNADLTWNFNVFQAPLLKELIFSVFILHAALAVKITFFRHNPLSGLIIFCLTPLILILVLLNF